MSYGVFTTLKVQDSRPVFFDAHRKRLLSQAEKLQIKLPSLSLEDVNNFLRTQELTSCALKITLTRETGLEFTVRPLPAPWPGPISLITVTDTRDDLKVYKTTDRQVCLEASRQAQELGAKDALFVTNGNIVESTICNVFSANSSGQLITPSVDGLGLAGIMRQTIMARADVLIQDIPSTTTGPLVLVNSLRISLADQLDTHRLQDGRQLFEKIKRLVKSAEND